MNTHTQTININIEIVLQLLELSERLIKLGYGSRTEANFVAAMNNDLSKILQAEETPATEQNNKVDENT